MYLCIYICGAVRVPHRHPPQTCSMYTAQTSPLLYVFTVFYLHIACAAALHVCTYPNTYIAETILTANTGPIVTYIPACIVACPTYLCTTLTRPARYINYIHMYLVCGWVVRYVCRVGTLQMHRFLLH